MRTIHRFLILLFVCLVIQGVLWKNTAVLDLKSWSKTVTAMTTWGDTEFDNFTQGYPGTPPLMISVAAHKTFGVAPDIAFRGSLAMIIAFSAAAIGMVVYFMQPSSPLWIAASLIVSFSMLPAHATPPSAIAIPLITLLSLYVWYLLRQSKVSFKYEPLLLGFIAGLSFASRYDISIAVFSFLILPIIYKYGWRFTGLTLLATISTLIILNPFIWFEPATHLQTFWSKLFYHAVEFENERRFELVAVLQKGIFAIIGFTLAIVSIIAKSFKDKTSRYFLVYLALVTASLVLGLSTLQYQATWYLFPLMQIWEVILLFALLALSRNLNSPFADISQVKFSSFSGVFVTFLIVSGFAALFVQYIAQRLSFNALV